MKKLLALTLLLSTAITTSHTMFAVALGTMSGKDLPKVVAANTTYEVTKHKGKKVNVSGAYVQKTENGHKIKPHTPGTTIVLKADGKTKRTTEVAHSSIRSAPGKVKEDAKIYIHNPEGRLKLQQSNKKDDNAGEVRVTNKYKSGDQTFIRISAKDEGTVHLADENGRLVKTLEIVE